MSLKKFVTPLRIPPILKPLKSGPNGTYYEVPMKQIRQKLHRDLPPTKVWAYSGTYPGPTIVAHKNEIVRVKWTNQLPLKSFLPVDTTVPGNKPPNPPVRTVVHLHGSVSRSASDGNPLSWFSRGFRKVGPMFRRKVLVYPNRQRASTLFYHDHGMGMTRLNVYAGLTGAYLLRDAHEAFLNLPKGKFEIPLIIQDKSFKKNGALFYPSNTTPPVKGVNPSIIPEFFGNAILVNGTVWPFLNVEPRKYRFRIVNGSNARFYRMKLSSGQSFIQIGTDQGLLRTPVLVRQLILAPAERADVIIDFSQHKGEKIVVTNDAPTPFPTGTLPDPKTTGQIMQFRVSRHMKHPDMSRVPKRLSFIHRLSPAAANRVRYLTLDETTDKYGRTVPLINRTPFEAPIRVKPRLGSIEVWNWVNVTPDTHPMHLHLVKFQIISRRPFDVNYYKKTKKIRFTGPPISPAPNERGWKDVVRANPKEVTTIIAKFVPYAGDYVFHCHILEHEDYDMMRPFRVVRGRLKPPLS